MLGDFTNNRIFPVAEGIERPLWSVMIPTFNPKDYIFEALESVLSQFPEDGSMQIEIVDDCSDKVDIPSMLKKLGDNRISYYRNPKNVGHSFNFTEAVRRSRGHLVHLLHDDDLVKPGFFETFAKIFNDYPAIGAAYCRQEYIDDDGNTMFFSNPDLDKTGILDDAVIKLAERQRIQYCAMVVRRSAYEKIGGYVMKNIGCEDWEMWVRIASQFDIAYEPEALAKYRIHTTSMTLTDMRTGQDMRFLREAADIFTKYLPEDKQVEVTKKRNIHYGNYSFENAKRLYEKYNDEQGAAAQFSETIVLDSNKVYSNLDIIRKFKTPVEGMGISIIIPVIRKDERLSDTIRQIANLRRFDYIPFEIVVADATAEGDQGPAALEAAERYRLKQIPRIIHSDAKNLAEVIYHAACVAKYEFLMMCLPGTYPDINYIKLASESMLMADDIAAIGGMVVPANDSELPSWLSGKNNLLGLGSTLPLSGLITTDDRSVHGSGAMIRKKALVSVMEAGFVHNAGRYPGSDEFLFESLSHALRATGWRLYYNSDLKARKSFTEHELSWSHLRKTYRSYGKLFPYIKHYRRLGKLGSEARIRKLGLKQDYRLSLYRRVRKTYSDLRKLRVWNTGFFEHSLEGNSESLRAERIFGTLEKVFSGVRLPLKRLRLLKRTVSKQDLRMFKNAMGEVHFDYPNYPRKFSRNGVSIVLINRATYLPHLYRALRNIASQKLPAGFRCELLLLSRHIDDEERQQIISILNTAAVQIPVNFAVADNLDDFSSIGHCLNNISYDNVIFLGENQIIDEGYIRIAYATLRRHPDCFAVGGASRLESSTLPPKWFKTYKSEFWNGLEPDLTANGQSHLYGKTVYGMLFNTRILKEKLGSLNIDAGMFRGSSIEEILSGISVQDYEHVKIISRLRLKYLVYPAELQWNNMRSKFRHADYRNIETGGAKSGSITQIPETIAKLGKYPLKKILSEGNQYKGDTDVLAVEKLKGRLSRLTGIGNGLNSANGNGYHPHTETVPEKKRSARSGVSVVICCYNSEDVLPMTLDKICRQKVGDDIEWEIVIVDNGSTDKTAETARESYENTTCTAQLRIVKETEPGLSAARLKGLSTARYDYVVFCDDDNHLDESFVELVHEIMNSDEKIGVLGGQSTGHFDGSRPEWFDTWKNSFAIGKQFREAGDITWKRGYVWGAAMAVRKSALKNLIDGGFRSLLTDRKGNALSAGGDTEICYALRNAGLKIWYDPRLKFRHHISRERLDWSYLRKLFRGFGQASAILDIYLREASRRYKGQFSDRKPGSKMTEMRRTIRSLRKVRYKKLLNFKRKREGDSDLPMIEYCLGRLEGLMSREGNYNNGLRLLKRTVRKRDLKYLSLPFRDSGSCYPRYDLQKKLNGVSVIVCTYNGASRLAETIRHIAKQKVDPQILWEVILVDNASTDNSKEVTINEWKKHNCNAKLIVVDQPVPGKQLALEKGYQVSNYEYWITCDDDNWLDENFVQLTYEIMSSNPHIGALGGPNEPLCEVKPPDWFNYFKRDYAGGPQPDVHTGIVSEGNITWKRGYVWGAGMIVRRTAWEQLLRDGFRTSMTCRKGTELSSGGDSEACYALVLAGWEIWYDSRLKLIHCMPGGRLSWDYLVRLFRGFGKATVGLELYEKAIQLARADADDEEINGRDWKYEYWTSFNALRKYGIRKLLSLRHPQDDNTEILMLEFHLEKLKELWKSRKEYDRNFEALKKAPWKKEFKYLKAQHRKYIESENDFRYGWPWSGITYRSYNEAQDKTDLPKISILSPSFNSQGTIEKAILSVLNQGYPNFEMIVCDGGSTDGTVEILKKYPQVKWISEPDKGQSDAMNKAFRMSTGDIIAYLNVDDYFQRGAFFEVARKFKENPEANMLISNLFFEFSNHTFTRVPEREYKKIMLPFRYMFPINPVSYFYKRRVQDEIGPFPLDNHFTMDYWFLLKAYQNFSIVQTDYHLGTFCMNGYNKTSNADNRKNTHIRVMYHCWHYDRKMLPYYMYNYYKHFYYDTKPWNLKSVWHKVRRQLKRIYSVLTLSKNKYYSSRLYELGRYRYYEKKRLRSIFWTASSFIMYPKSIKSSERWNVFLPALFGLKYSEKLKDAYRFLAYPPGMSLAHKLTYYGSEYRKSGKSLKGRSLLMLAFIASPAHFFRNDGTGSHPKGKPGSLKQKSGMYFDKAGYYYHNKKRFNSLIWVLMSLAVYPVSSTQRSRRTLLAYSLFGENFISEANIIKHLYKDDKQYDFAYKLNYYGKKQTEEGRKAYGKALLIATYLMSPKYFKERGKHESGKVIVSKQSQSRVIRPVSNILDDITPGGQLREGVESVSSKLEGTLGDKLSMLRFKIQQSYDFFRYRKFKAKSKFLYADAQDFYYAGKKSKVPGPLISSFLFYPPSLLNRNKWSLLMNSLLSDSTLTKIKRSVKGRKP